jgi:hypothetical protein
MLLPQNPPERDFGGGWEGVKVLSSLANCRLIRNSDNLSVV